MRCIISTASRGYRPMAVSPESMQASAPSRIALATSVTSARVGSRDCCMLSSICVAMITGLRWRLQTAMISFWTTATRAMSISTPRSPRATITPSAASTISCELIQRLGLLDLGDHLGRCVVRLEQRLQLADLGRRADEAQTEEVDADVGRPDRVVQIVGPERGHAELHARQIDPLATTDQPGLHHATPGPVGPLLLDDQRDGAVGQHDAVAGGQFVDQRFIGGGQVAGPRGLGVGARVSSPLRRAIQRTSGATAGLSSGLCRWRIGLANEPQPGARVQGQLAAGQLAQPDLRPGQVGQHGHRLADLGRDPADRRQPLLLLRPVAMGHVQPKDVDASGHQIGQLAFFRTGRPDGSHDLRLRGPQGAEGVVGRHGAASSGVGKWGNEPTPIVDNQPGLNKRATSRLAVAGHESSRCRRRLQSPIRALFRSPSATRVASYNCRNWASDVRAGP